MKTNHTANTNTYPLSTVRLIYERANVRNLGAALNEGSAEARGGRQWAQVTVFCTPEEWDELTAGYHDTHRYEPHQDVTSKLG